MTNYEVEVKFKLNDQLEEKLHAFLNKYSHALFIEEKITDVYYNHPCRDFRSTDEALRLRVVNEKANLTYKGPRLDAFSKVREEIEVKNVDFQNLHNVLIKLGFVEFVRIVKIRRTYIINDITVSIDYLPELGKYAEVEKICKSQTEIPNVQQELLDFLKNNIDSDIQKYVEPKTYLELILERKQNV